MLKKRQEGDRNGQAGKGRDKWGRKKQKGKGIDRKAQKKGEECYERIRKGKRRI